MKKLLVAFLVISILFGAIFGVISYYENSSNNSENINNPTLIYNSESGKWEEIDQDIPRIKREELEKDPNEDGFHNMSLLRGYFDHYDEQNEEIVIKSLLPFTMGRGFEIVNLKAPVNKAIYCAPSITVVPKTGQEILTANLYYPVKNEQILSITNESLIAFDKFISEAKEDTYLFVQLTKDFDKEKTSYIKKLIVIGLCD